MAPLLVAMLVLTGCGGDVSQARITLGQSSQFSRDELQAAADAVLAKFKTMDGLRLEELSYDEAFSTAQLIEEPAAGTDVVIFDSVFKADVNGGDRSFEPNSTNNWTWQVERSGTGADWTLTNWGVG